MKTKDILEKLICSQIETEVNEPKNLNARIKNAPPEYSAKKFTVTLEFLVRGNPDGINKEDVANYFFKKFQLGN